MKAEIIRSFLEDPKSLRPVEATSKDIWSSGISEIVVPAIKKFSLKQLRQKQLDACMGFAGLRCALLLGPPGTGKTTVAAWMVVGYSLACRRAGVPCRVLVSAFTRNAIVNLLQTAGEHLAEIGEELPICFAGNEPEEAEGVSCVSLEELPSFLKSDQCIVGMTTWACYRAMAAGELGSDGGLEAEVFDVLCLDEASQLKVGQALMALAPLREGARVVVAGDDRQLGPIGFESWAEVAPTLTGSFYGFLRTAGISEFALTETFRLNAPLAEAPRELFYDELFPSESAAARRVVYGTNWDVGLSSESWIRAALNPEFPVCILLHDGPPAASHSPFEVSLVSDLVSAIAPYLADEAGNVYGDQLWARGLAVLAPHRAQIAAIRRKLAESPHGNGCVVETVDRIQGRERDAIIVSYGVSDLEYAQAESAFLFSPNRFNVAITRPKSKLIVILSRRLLEVLPPDEEVFDSVRLLREWVFGSEHAGTVEHSGFRVDVRLRRFDDTQPLPVIEPQARGLDPLPISSPRLDELDRVIRELAGGNSKYGNAASFDVEKRLRANRVQFSDYRDLFRLGRVALARPRAGEFWSLYPCGEVVVPFPRTSESVRNNITAVVALVKRGGKDAQYAASSYGRGVRDYFLWCDQSGADVLWPLLEDLQRDGVIRLGVNDWGYPTVAVVPGVESEAIQLPALAPLSDADFRLLNVVEELEIGRIELGVFETWLVIPEIRTACELERVHYHSLELLTAALARVEAHGFLMLRDGRVRSRMAELARELRYSKQRFRVGDQDSRPFLVRSAKLLAVPREKPVRDVVVEPVAATLADRVGDKSALAGVLRALPSALRRAFGVRPSDALLFSGFQVRGLEQLTAAWVREPGSSSSVVITADTGAGKTEAACLPLLAGAAADRLGGIRGTRAIFAYPRIRLAVNQAARIARYSAALGAELGLRVTVGLQSGSVPRDYDHLDSEIWHRDEDGGWKFPFFPCPGSACAEPLSLLPGGAGEEADSLCCRACGWRFDGWVGTKEGLRRDPPAIFLAVTESLHQWLQDPKYGTLFGDYAQQFAAPRALVADEIHLYSHIHGAQVGWTLRRLLARWRENGEERPIAIGMSATLGSPAAVWADLTGEPVDRVLSICPATEERRENPRGREYFFFLQPEVESRGKDIAGASTTIQSLMLLSHSMRRRSGFDGGFRSLVFLDSIDKLKRLHGDYVDAETRKALAALRTRDYGPDAQDPTLLRTECCHEPETCERFRDGECWYFAATDSRQVRANGRLQVPGDPFDVCRSPVFSATSGNVDEIIESSDVVFATSTLEVGYDDPAIALVYQHYAPTNLASFVQRKGRGGRGADDRPFTGVTLSAHSPRDAWYFRNPRQMLSAADFRVPLNMRNMLVQRGQVLALLLDMLARHVAQTNWLPQPDLPAPVLEATRRRALDIFGAEVFADLELSLEELWAQALAEVDGGSRALGRELRGWREKLPYVPKRLFDPINLPVLAVDWPSAKEAKVEDVALALGETAPGRVTFRWGSFGDSHWIPPQGQLAPWFGAAQGGWREFDFAPGMGADERLRLIPDEVRTALLGKKVDEKILRPTRIKLESAGKLGGTTWKPAWGWDTKTRSVVRLAEMPKAIPIHHKSHGSLLGFVLVVAERPGRRDTFESLDELAGGELEVFLASSGRSETGLRVTQAYWACDSELVLDTPRRDRQYYRQVFASPESPGTPKLVGYGMRPEGIRLSIDSGRLDHFLEKTMSVLQIDPRRDRWHRGQFLRYSVMTQASGAGLTRFEARQLAELCACAVAIEELREELRGAFERGNMSRLGDALEVAWSRHLRFHPQLGRIRVEKLRERLVQLPGVDRAMKDVWTAVADREKFRGYLRSSVLLGLLASLRQLFVLNGLTEERNVIGHVRVPLQFGADTSDVLTLCERGGGGDGTTRAFLERAPEVFTQWTAEKFIKCPNAAADAVLDRLASREQSHAQWQKQDPRNPDWVRRLATELEIDTAVDSSPIQLVLRLLYGTEAFGGGRIEVFGLFLELRRLREALAHQLARQPTDWELVSTVVALAVGNDPAASKCSQLLQAYGKLEEALDEGTLSPEGRLADQIYRISGTLCVDGCQGCLHTSSDLMDDDLAQVCVSRILLAEFGEHLSSN